jgi:outer membrane protein OmpA-like peptidoglycan-associated protein
MRFSSLSLLFLSVLIMPLNDVFSQEEGIVHLRNPSFEDLPRNSEPPRGWTDCGFPGETAPDVQPDPEFLFEVRKPAYDQNTYLGMVTRDNDTWESVGQQLTTPLVGGQCYEFRIHLARSEIYMSRSRRTKARDNYVDPIKLRIHGGYSICDKGNIIGESALVYNFEWQEFRIKLRPEQDFTHIILEAFYNTPILIPYNGNILLDNVQPLVPIDCEKNIFLDEPAMVETEVENPENNIQVSPVVPRQNTRSPEPVPTMAAPKEPTVRLGRTEAVLKEGQIFAIENINFRANSAELTPDSEEALQEIVGFMQQNENVIVEIGGHASRMAGNTFAASVSEDRAKTVVGYLKSYNIGFERMIPRGYGKSRPVCLDSTQDCNKRNQRVEVKILKLKESR